MYINTLLTGLKNHCPRRYYPSHPNPFPYVWVKVIKIILRAMGFKVKFLKKKKSYFK